MATTRFRWRIDWRLTLLTAVLLPLCLSLGVWQLGRAQEKAVLAATFAERRAQPAQALDEAAADLPDYTPVWLAGRYLDERYFLLDNSVRNRQFGFEVVAPFVTGGGKVVLVNRGWIAGDPGRRTLPDINVPNGHYRLTGYVHRPLLGPRLGADADDRSWPQIVQQPDIELLAKRLRQPLPGYIIRLDADAPTALLTGWPVISQTPATHIGYAVQWFGLAAVAIGGWLLASTNLLQLIRGNRNGGK
ncbi:MAG: SURF1 family protein [Spongiibacteraceae bacterium]|nr:SURF1 family protein [Spongiibacteraceae bacterium]